MKIISLLYICAQVGFLSAQNAGIGTATPSEKLEVAGIIYTNEGGIKFPDGTVQTTAAFNAPPATESLKRGGGFAKFFKATLDGPLDTLGKTKMTLLYDVRFPMFRPPSGNVQAGPTTLIKQTDRGTPGFFSHLALGTIIPDIEIYLTKINNSGIPEIYMTIYLTDAIVSKASTELSREYYGYYSNVDIVELMAETMAIKDLMSGNCYCFNLVTNTSCSCP